jgi:hypothetical protein
MIVVVRHDSVAASNMSDPFEFAGNLAPNSTVGSPSMGCGRVSAINGVSVLLGLYSFGAVVYVASLLSEPGAWRVLKFWRKSLVDYQIMPVIMTSLYLIPSLVIVMVLVSAMAKSARFTRRVIVLYGLSSWLAVSAIQQLVRRTCFDVHQDMRDVAFSVLFLLTCFAVGTTLAIALCSRPHQSILLKE